MKELDRFRDLLRYDPETGRFYWKANRGKGRVGAIAGAVSDLGYLVIMIDGKRIRASRMAWLFTHNEWPKNFIDHINHDRSDDRISNLRDVNYCTNNRNRAKKRDLPCGIQRVGRGYRARVGSGKLYCSRTMPNVTMALLWLAALRAKYDPVEAA